MPESDNSEIPLPDVEEAVLVVNPATVRFAAMNLLARREHSLGELRLKLGRRFADAQIVECELQRLAAENLQSDQRYAESYVRQRSGRGYGPQRVRQEMRERGLGDEEVRRAFEAAAVDWCALAAEVFDKKFAQADMRDISQQARCSRFMHYRGFSRDHYRHLLDS